MEMGLVQTTETLSQVRGRGRPDRSEHVEYLLVVYPHGDLKDRLMEEQAQFSSDYGLDHRLDQLQRIIRNKPHLTLAAFHAGEEVEDTLIRWLQRICQERRCFEIALNNYSGIPPHSTNPAQSAKPANSANSTNPAQSTNPAHSVNPAHSAKPPERITGTIYLRVQDPEPLRELMEQLSAIDEYIRSSGWPPVQLMRRPHVSIAGGLTEQVYNKAMPDYSRKTFHGVFRVDELVLLKRRHSFDPCKTVTVFGLKS